MTTIAYKDGVMAADSLATCNGIRNGTFGKAHFFEIKSGGWCLVGFCGEPAHIAKALADVVSKNEDPRKSDVWPEGEYTALIAVRHHKQAESPPELYLFEGRAAPFQVTTSYLAIGTGAEIATGAMAVGATALQAVKTAIDLDTNSGGPAVSVSFKDL